MAKKKIITFDPNKATPLVAIDWTTMFKIKPFFQKALNTYLLEGKTTQVRNHSHKYKVDKNGNGWAEVSHQNVDSRLKHRHKIIKWKILESQSECYPNCEKLLGIKGVLPHVHSFNNKKAKKYEDRYSITIVTEYTSTGGDKLQDRMDEQISKGVSKILNYYNKKGTEDIFYSGFAENWDIDPRPQSKLKVLISLPSSVCDSLPDLEPPTTHPIADKEIFLNTYNLEGRLLGAQNLLLEYDRRNVEFYGSTHGLDFVSEANKLATFYPALTELMQNNDIDFRPTKDYTVALGVGDKYQPLYVLYNGGDGFKNLYKRYDIFTNYDALRHDRTINFLINLNKINEIYDSGVYPPMLEFCNEYVLKAPPFDFTRQSITKHLAKNQRIEKLENRPGFSSKIPWSAGLDQVDAMRPSYVETTYKMAMDPKNRKAWEEGIAESVDWVGDTIMGGGKDPKWWSLGGALKGMNSLENMYHSLLNKIPIQNLLLSALECLRWRGITGLDEVGTAWRSSQALLSNANAFLATSLPLFKIPSLVFGGQDLPTVDFLDKTLKQLKAAVISAMTNAALTMVLMVLETLLDMCNECGVGDVGADGKPLGYARITPNTIIDSMNSGAGREITNTLFGLAGGDPDAAARGEDAARKAALDISINAGANPNKAGSYLTDEDVDSLNEWMFTWFTDGMEDLDQATRSGGQSATPEPKPNSETADTQATGPNPKKDKIEQAKQEMSQFLETSFAVTTPEEMANLLMGCQVGNQVEEALKSAAHRYPMIKESFSSNDTTGEIDGDRIKNTFKIFGSLIGPTKVLDTIKDIIEATPAEFRCGCDEDEQAIKRALLEDKEDMTQDQIDDALSRSLARKQQKIEDLLNNLNKENPFEDAKPALFCTKRPDGTIKEGIMKEDPPIISQHMDDVLDTIYDGISMTFNLEVDRFIPQLQEPSYKWEKIERTFPSKDRYGNYTGEREFNPRFLSILKEKNWSHGPIPFGSLKPGYSGREDQEQYGSVKGARGWAWDFDLWDGIPDAAHIGDESPHRVGMMDEGQTRPTPRQEYLWEIKNIDRNLLKERGSNLELMMTEPIGGRYERDKKVRPGPGDEGIPPWEWTERFGFSPIPIIEKTYGGEECAVGLKQAYEGFCNADVFKISTLESKYSVYEFDVPNNFLSNAGIDLDNIPLDMETAGSQGSITVSPQVMKDSMASVKAALTSIGSSKIDIDYVVPYFQRDRPISEKDIYKDVYSLSIKMTPLDKNPAILHNQLSSTPLIAPVKTLIEVDSLDISKEPPLHTPQEKYFAEIINKAWTTGNRVWRDQKVIMEKPDYSEGYLPSDSDLEAALKGVYYDQKAYDGVFEDLMCSIALQIGESPLLRPDGKIISAINLHPMRETGKENCDPHLMAIDGIKQRIKDEYRLVQCLEQAYLMVGKDGPPESKPFLRSNLGGAAIATVRLYVLEIMLRSIFAFFYFRYNKVEDIDSTLVDYIVTHMKTDISQKGFLNEFSKAIIDLFNRNMPGSKQVSNNTGSGLDTVLKWFVRNQIWAVTNTLSGIVGATGKTDLDSILLEAWIPTYDMPNSKRGINGELRFDKLPKSFEEAVSVPTVSPAQIMALKSDLSEGTINKMRAKGGAIGGRWGELYNNPVGLIFRHYFPSSSPRTVWSLESSQLTEDNPRYSKYDYGEGLSASKTGGSVPFQMREYHLLAKAISTGDDNALLTKLTLGDEFTADKLIFKNSPGDERIGIPPSEREALVLLTKIISGINAVGGKGDYANSKYAREISNDAMIAITRKQKGFFEHTSWFSPGSWLRFYSKKSAGRVEEKANEIRSGSSFSEFIKNKPGLLKRFGHRERIIVNKEGDVHNVWSPFARSEAGHPNGFRLIKDPDTGKTYHKNVDSSHHDRWFWAAGVHFGWSLTSFAGGDKYEWVLGTKGGEKIFRHNDVPLQQISNALNPTGKRGDGFLRLFNRTKDLIERGDSPYMSLLDFDLTSAELIIGWEQRIWKNIQQQMKAQLNENWDFVKTTAAINDLQRIIDTYDIWIADWRKMKGLFEAGENERRNLREKILEDMEKYPVARRELLVPKTKDLTNGNLIQEVFIRIKDLDPTKTAPEGTEDVIRYVNPEIVVKNKVFASRDGSSHFASGYGDGLVNIDAFQRFMDNKFGANTFPSQTNPAIELATKIVGDEEAGELITIGGECGLTLTTKSSKTPVSEDRAGDVFRLRDFFENLSIGIRISYVLPVNNEDFTADGEESIGVLRTVKNSQTNREYIVNRNKAYFVEEEKTDESGATIKRNVKIIPLAYTEKSFDMDTKIIDCINKSTTHEVMEGDVRVNKSFGYFANFYRDEAYPLAYSMRNTPEYKMLFKYLFPIDRMLSIANIYSSTFLSSKKELGGLFDGTKDKLKNLFFIINNTGNPYLNCNANNELTLSALLNGIPIAGMSAMMAIIIAKTVLLIFKGFMETADINIVTSRSVIKIIRLANKAIAQAQMLANSAAQTWDAFGDILQDCEAKADEAATQIITDANEMVEQLLKIKTYRIEHPLITENGKINSDGWDQSRLLKEADVDEDKRAAIMQFETWSDENYPELFQYVEKQWQFLGVITVPDWLSRGYNPEGETNLGRFDAMTAQVKSSMNPERFPEFTAVFEKAKELNPKANVLKEIANFNCREEQCAPGNQQPSMPPDDLFDPIDENFITEPKIWQIGMALLPFTLIPFSPTPFPLTIPHGLIYWVMDEKPMPDWLNCIPPADFLDKLFAKDDPEVKETLGVGKKPDPEDCKADVGLPPPGKFDDDKFYN